MRYGQNDSFCSGLGALTPGKPLYVTSMQRMPHYFIFLSLILHDKGKFCNIFVNILYPFPQDWASVTIPVCFFLFCSSFYISNRVRPHRDPAVWRRKLCRRPEDPEAAAVRIHGNTVSRRSVSRHSFSPPYLFSRWTSQSIPVFKDKICHPDKLLKFVSGFFL